MINRRKNVLMLKAFWLFFNIITNKLKPYFRIWWTRICISSKWLPKQAKENDNEPNLQNSATVLI